MEQSIKALPHKVVMEDCARLSAGGVQAIISYDSQSAVLQVPGGQMVVGGSELCVSELNVQTGEIKVQGNIEYIQYTKRRDKKDSIFKRLVR